MYSRLLREYGSSDYAVSHPFEFHAKLLLGHRSGLGIPHGILEGREDFKTSLLGARSLDFVQASDMRDYVLSIWADWPAYQIPMNYRALSAEALLADALRQYHEAESLTVLSTCPAG